MLKSGVIRVGKDELGSARTTAASFERRGGTGAVAKLGAASPPHEAVRHNFEECGLNGYEARVLVALLQAGSATAPQLAKLAGIHRTSVYPVLQELSAKGLCEEVAGRRGEWSSLGHDELIERLQATQDERFRQLRTTLERTRTMLAELATNRPHAALPYVHFVRTAAHAKKTYEILLRRAKEEVLMFTRPPFSWRPGEPNAVVLEALERNVSIRVLYDASLYEARYEALRREIEVYHEAGVDARVLEGLPIKLVVVDRAVTLVAMTDSLDLEQRYPTNLLVEHEGFSIAQAAAFERLWIEGRPLGSV